MAKGIPVGWHSITPRLVVNDPATLVEFLKQAFERKGEFRTDLRRKSGSAIPLS